MFSWKHYFYSVFSKTQLFKNKNCMLKKTENLWKIVGCFWTWQMVSLGFGFFEVLILKRFVFGVSGIVSKVLKMLVFFPSFLGFSGVACYCSSGFGRFRWFCVSCVCFSLLCCFCFCFVCFVIGFVFGFVFCFVFFFSVFFCFFVCFFVFFWFVFLEGLRVRWGGPKGHLTWP